MDTLDYLVKEIELHGVLSDARYENYEYAVVTIWQEVNNDKVSIMYRMIRLDRPLSVIAKELTDKFNIDKWKD